MTAGVSSWWATPARPDRHFTTAELLRSERHHGRLRRVGMLSTAAKAALLIGALAAAGAFGDRDIVGGPFERSWPDDHGWLAAVVSPRVLLGSAMVVLALWVPATVADAWFEFRFRHGRPDHVAVPPVWFALTTTMVAVGSLALVAVLTAVLYRLAAVRADWARIVLVASAVGLAAVAVGERWIRQLSPGQETEVDPDSELGVELQAVAARLGLSGLRFGTTARAPGSASVETGPNAFSMGVGRNRRVVLTEALLAEDVPTRDFVVAHELTHLRRHHVAAQSVAQLALPVSAVVVFAALSNWDRLWEVLSLDPLDPLGVASVPLVVGAVSIVVGVVPSWLARAHERTADAGAVAAMGPLPDNLARRLYLVPDVDLDPPWWNRLLAAHPAPAERLEYLSRSGMSEHRHPV